MQLAAHLSHMHSVNDGMSEAFGDCDAGRGLGGGRPPVLAAIGLFMCIDLMSAPLHRRHRLAVRPHPPSTPSTPSTRRPPPLRPGRGSSATADSRRNAAVPCSSRKFDLRAPLSRGMMCAYYCELRTHPAGGIRHCRDRPASILGCGAVSGAATIVTPPVVRQRNGFLGSVAQSE